MNLLFTISTTHHVGTDFGSVAEDELALLVLVEPLAGVLRGGLRLLQEVQPRLVLQTPAIVAARFETERCSYNYPSATIIMFCNMSIKCTCHANLREFFTFKSKVQKNLQFLSRIHQYPLVAVIVTFHISVCTHLVEW